MDIFSTFTHMFKPIATLLFCLSLLLAAAGAEKVDTHGNYFATGGRKICINTPKETPQLKKELSEFFASCGATIMDGFFARIIYPDVTLSRGAVEGTESEGFSIKVSGSKIAVRYTSLPYARKAVDHLKTLYTEPYAQRMIKGVNVVSTTSIKSGKQVTAPSINGQIVDCSATYQNVGAICAAVKRAVASGNRSVTVLMASPAAFRLNLECFKLFNPTAPIVPANEAYTAANYAEIVQFAQSNNIRVMLGVDLLADNEKFEQWSAHKLSSVEGMRIVRAVIEELGAKWGVKRLYIGRSKIPQSIDRRYHDFLKKIAADNKIELIIL